MKKQIAIVEDEPALRENYAAALARHGYSIKTYGNRRTAMQAFNTRLPDLAIIDISLEDEAEGGFDLCRDLRALSAELPIIFLTARDSELDAVSGLRLGADDFLTKDVSLPHLAARVAALFRRIDALRRPDNAAEIVRRGALSIDGEKMQTTWNGAPVTLSLTEFWIVHALGEEPGPCEESPTIDGRRECGIGRQHHHLAYQARAAQVSAGRCRFRRHPDRVRNGLSLGRVSIRLQLLIVALTTLVLPWAGCQYARELETALRSSQEQSLVGERRHHCQRPIRATAARVPRCRRYSGILRRRGRSLCLSFGDAAAARWLSRGLGCSGGADPAAHHDRVSRARFRPARPRASSICSSKFDDSHFDAEPYNVRPDTDRFDRVNLALDGPNGREAVFFRNGCARADCRAKRGQGRGWRRSSGGGTANSGILAADGGRATTWKPAYP